MPQQEFKQTLTLKDGVLLVAGSMIGSGVFMVAPDMLRNIGSGGWLLLAWLITGVMTLTAALSYGELAGMFPRAGGQYVYLKEAYNPLAGFLYGWSFFTVIQTGTIAAVAMAFAKFTGVLIPYFNEDNIYMQIGNFKLNHAQPLAIISILIITYISTRGIEGGKKIQTIFTVAKFTALFGLIIAGFFFAKESFFASNTAMGLTASKAVYNTSGKDVIAFENITGIALLGGIAAAMVGSIFSSDAWNNITFIAGEVKRPERNIPLSLFYGTLIVTIVYILANAMYLHVLPILDITNAPKDRVATAVAQKLFGNNGAYFVAIMIMISTFGCNNGLIISGSRMLYTMAKDKLFIPQAGTLNKNQVPEAALWMQAVWACILCLSGRYGDLLDYVSFVVVLFYILTIIGVFILRKKQPNTPRPYKTFGYPILPILYIIMATAFCMLLLKFKPNFTWPGLILVCIGIPIYFIINRKKA
jgi:basic amino acid/polyamine antiporter, APA family